MPIRARVDAFVALDGESGHRGETILVVDGDSITRDVVRGACEAENYDVVEVDGGLEALRFLETVEPNAIVMEVDLVDLSGVKVCVELRKRGSTVPVLMLGTSDAEADVVAALACGADDYLVKPIRPHELVARVSACIRRHRSDPAASRHRRLEFRELVIDVDERTVHRSGEPVRLTHTEFDLLALLATNAGRALSRERILNAIWGFDYPLETRVIDVHIRNLRRKLETHPSRPRLILSVPGVGYRFTNARP